MLPTDAADLIDEVISSIKDDPGQFHLAINVTGQHITSSGGTGLHVSVTGGGPGSYTVGNKVSLSGVNIDIGRQKGAQAFEQQLDDLIRALSEISEQLRSQAPDKSRVQSILASLKNTWVPGVITEVVGNAVSKALLSI